MITNNRGSECLIGAASLRNRMPVIFGVFRYPQGYSSTAEQQPSRLRVAGSNPAFHSL